MVQNAIAERDYVAAVVQQLHPERRVGCARKLVNRHRHRRRGGNKVFRAGRAAVLPAGLPVCGRAAGPVPINFRERRTGAIRGHRPIALGAESEAVHQAARVIVQIQRAAVVVQRADEWPKHIRGETSGRLKLRRIPRQQNVAAARHPRAVWKRVVRVAADPPVRDVHGHRHLIVKFHPLHPGFISGGMIHDFIEDQDGVGAIGRAGGQTRSHCRLRRHARSRIRSLQNNFGVTRIPVVGAGVLGGEVELHKGNIRGERHTGRGGDGYPVGGNAQDGGVVKDARQRQISRGCRHRGVRDGVKLAVAIHIRPPAVNHDVGERRAVNEVGNRLTGAAAASGVGSLVANGTKGPIRQRRHAANSGFDREISRSNGSRKLARNQVVGFNHPCGSKYVSADLVCGGDYEGRHGHRRRGSALHGNLTVSGITILHGQRGKIELHGGSVRRNLSTRRIVEDDAVCRSGTCGDGWVERNAGQQKEGRRIGLGGI